MVENIRKGLNLTFLGLSIVPFGFSKMEAYEQIFETKIQHFEYKSKHHAIRIDCIHPLKYITYMPKDPYRNNSSLEASYIFLYDRTTGYSIGNYILKDCENLNQCKAFFKGRMNVDTSHLIFFSLQENLGLITTENKQPQYVVVERDCLGKVYIKNPFTCSIFVNNKLIDFKKKYVRVPVHKQITLPNPNKNKISRKKKSKFSQNMSQSIEKNAYVTKGCMHLWNKYDFTQNNCDQCNPIWDKKSSYLYNIFNEIKRQSWNKCKLILAKYWLNDMFSDGIKISDFFSSKSGVRIENKKEKVLVNNIDFQNALTKYYFDEEDKKRILAESIYNLRKEGIGCKISHDLWKVVNRSKRSKDEKELLDKSNILAVYAVMKGKFGNDSIVWGLAEDKVTKIPFHWLTDLKADISVLVNQYKK